MTAAERVEELQRLREWQGAYERTDLLCRLLAALVEDYRSTLDLPDVIGVQLDRIAESRGVEDQAYDVWKHTAGVA